MHGHNLCVHGGRQPAVQLDAEHGSCQLALAVGATHAPCVPVLALAATHALQIDGRHETVALQSKKIDGHERVWDEQPVSKNVESLRLTDQCEVRTEGRFQKWHQRSAEGLEKRHVNLALRLVEARAMGTTIRSRGMVDVRI